LAPGAQRHLQIYFLVFSVSIHATEIFVGVQIMSFEQAFAQHPCNVERIAEEPVSRRERSIA
jgi:hypothetical protein